MKNNLQYYSHDVDSHEHPKFYFLRSKYGWEGEGMFWALNNMIARSEDCILNLDRKFSKAPIAEKFGRTIQEFDEFIDFLAEDCELILRTEYGITTKQVQENYDKVSSDREKARNRKSKTRSKTPSSGEQLKSSPELSESSPTVRRKKQQSKVKESKVNKSKEEESKKEAIIQSQKPLPAVSSNFKESNYFDLLVDRIGIRQATNLENTNWLKLDQKVRTELVDYLSLKKEKREEIKSQIQIDKLIKGFHDAVKEHGNGEVVKFISNITGNGDTKIYWERMNYGKRKEKTQAPVKYVEPDNLIKPEKPLKPNLKIQHSVNQMIKNAAAKNAIN